MRNFFLIISTLISLISTEVVAQTVRQSSKVTASLASSCQISTNDVDLGILESHKYAIGQIFYVGKMKINVKCSRDLTYYFSIPKDSGGPTQYWTKLPNIEKTDAIWLYISCTSVINGTGNCITGAPTLTDTSKGSWTSKKASGKEDVWTYDIQAINDHFLTPGVYTRTFPLTLTF